MIPSHLEATAQAFRANGEIYLMMRTPLYAEFCRYIVDDPDMLTLAESEMMDVGRPTHLFSAVHYLLLREPDGELSRYFATIDDNPLPPEGAYPALKRFCDAHKAEIRELLETRSVQTTYAERCRALLAPMCVVAKEAGEPLNLIEIGCSGGVLLTFDKYAYRLNNQGVVGPADAPLLLEGEVHGGPELFIPRIGTRIGMDLHTIDVQSEEERRWLLALCFPELRDEQRRLATALNVVAQTEIRLMEGDALIHIKEALADTTDPVCVFHSSCLFYWPAEACAKLEEMLCEASLSRPIWRIAIEPSYIFEPAGESQHIKTGAIYLLRYRNGTSEREILGWPTPDFGITKWRK